MSMDSQNNQSGSFCTCLISDGRGKILTQLEPFVGTTHGIQYTAYFFFCIYQFILYCYDPCIYRPNILHVFPSVAANCNIEFNQM